MTLTFDLESGVRVTCDVGYTSVPILVFLGLSVLDLSPMYRVRDRQTDIRQKHRLMSSPISGGGIINKQVGVTAGYVTVTVTLRALISSRTAVQSYLQAPH